MISCIKKLAIDDVKIQKELFFPETSKKMESANKLNLSFEEKER